MKKITFWLLISILATIQSTLAQDNTGLIRNLRGHFTSVQSLAFSPDSKILISVASNPQSKMSEIKVWDTRTGKEIRSFQEQDEITDIDLSLDGQYFATSSSNAVKVWSLKTGSVLHSLKAQARQKVVRFSPYSSYTNIVIGNNKTVKTYQWKDIRSNYSNLITFNVAQNILDLSLTSKNNTDNYLAFCGGDLYAETGFIQIEQIDIADLKYVKTIQKITTKSVINSVALSPDGERFVSGAENGELLIRETKTGKIVQNLTQRFGQVSKVAFSPDGRFVLSASKNSNIKLWQVSNGKLIHTFRGHFKRVNDIAFSPKGNLIASAGEDKMAKLWQALPARRMIELYVEDKMSVWQKKGKFEKTSDYQARVSGSQRQEKIATYTQEAINAIAKESIELSPIKSEYDADNEAFRLVFDNLEPVFVKIPLTDAPDFDKAVQSKALNFETPNFTLDNQNNIALLSAKITNKQNNKTYSYNAQNIVAFNANQLTLELDPIAINTPAYTNNQNNRNNQNNTGIRTNGISEVDYNLPKAKTQRPNAVAVVIGNALYRKTKNVNYAIADARSMRNYLLDVMGFKRGNIIYLENATYTDFKLIFGDKENPKGKLYNMVKPNVSEVFVFYSGHGAPGLKDKKAYFVPVECDPQYVELTGYPTDYLYNNLAKIPTKSTVVALDACFSGENIYENISPIVIKSKGALGLKDGALLASCKADQVSTWYNEKGHGMFTYFLLKAMHNKNADKNKDSKLTLEEIHTYIADNTNGVPYYARRLHGIEQNPVIKGQNIQKVLVEYE